MDDDDWRDLPDDYSPELVAEMTFLGSPDVVALDKTLDQQWEVGDG